MLEVKDATITRGERVLAKGLSFIAKDGELTCVTGPQGSGKTTLLRTLLGFLPLTEGFVSVDGELLTVHSAHAFRTMMVYLPQEMQMLRHQLRAPEPPQSEADDYAVWNALLPSVKPEPQPEPLPSEDIFLLAERLVTEATDRQIIIADEPAAHLDAEQERHMLELLRRQTAAGKTVLIASRRPLLVSQANQVIEMKQ
ncbi:MAG: ATP-binding cassette domain-containing protein [Prevotella sp.]|nr:ATP-binding cassette domain-containing protein [Prevotella sp.]